MKKRNILNTVAVLLLCVCTSCQQPVTQPVIPSVTPQSSVDELTQAQDYIALESLSIEYAAEIYSRFLEGEFASADGYWVTVHYDLEGIKDLFMVRDLTGDGMPEIYHDAPGNAPAIWSIENGQIVSIAFLGTYHTLLANGGVFYHRLGGGPTHDDYAYSSVSPESKAFPDVNFSIYYADEAHNLNEICFLNGEEVTREEWQEVADIYFALRDAELDETQIAVAFSEWIASLDVKIEPLPLSEPKASRLFWRFLANRWCGYDLSGNEIMAYNWYSDYDLIGMTQFMIWDFTCDGIPEVYLPIFSCDVWTIRDNHITLLGTLEEMDTMPEYSISFLEWLDGTVTYKSYEETCGNKHRP